MSMKPSSDSRGFCLRLRANTAQMGATFLCLRNLNRRKARMVNTARMLTTTEAMRVAGDPGAVIAAMGLDGSHFGGELIPVMVGFPPATSSVPVPVASGPPADPAAPVVGELTACLITNLSSRGLPFPVFGRSRNSSYSSAVEVEVVDVDEAELDDEDDAPLLFVEVVDDDEATSAAAAAAGDGEVEAALCAGFELELAFCVAGSGC